jgi:MerR family mercuric resistance operon transcriptional regulator
MQELTIAGLARAGQVGVEAVRFYQRRGLIRVPKRPESGGLGGGIRRYGEDDVRRLRFIRHAQSAGFTLAEIAELLALDATHDRPRVRAIVAGRIAALDKKIAELRCARTGLAKLAQVCCEGSAGPCPILAAFDDP